MHNQMSYLLRPLNYLVFQSQGCWSTSPHILQLSYQNLRRAGVPLWTARRGMSADSHASRQPLPVVGVCQVTCAADKEANFNMCKSLIQHAKDLGAKMVFLPEACDYIGESKQQSMELSESITGETITQYSKLAMDLGLWLSVGGFHQKAPEESSHRVYNTHVIIDNEGRICDTYSKTHMFDLDIKDKVRLCESDYTIPGPRISPPVQTPVGKVGMGICYDLRFPEFSQSLVHQGAQILTYPSAFTVPTGMAHWEVLLRNRAIESQCYVIAAAQTGKHNAKRSSYGHSMVVDPWGTVIAQCKEGVGVCMAQIDLEYLAKVRLEMPVALHKRADLYGSVQLNSIEGIDSQQVYQFGAYRVIKDQVFYRSPLCYAFVNIKPVLPGHVLVAPFRPAERLCDLTSAEVADMFNTVQKVSSVIQKHFQGTALTIAVQDGRDAGQTVMHVHTHILPRKPGDLPENDDIYKELEHHDKGLGTEEFRRSQRSEEVMAQEAATLRTYFY